MKNNETAQKRERLNDIMFNINQFKTKEKVQEASQEACSLMVDLGILEKEDQHDIPKAFHLYQEYVKKMLQADLDKHTARNK